MEYEIVKADSHGELVREVAGWIESGWRPQGGVCICQRFYEGKDAAAPLLWAQAVVREREEGQE